MSSIGARGTGQMKKFRDNIKLLQHVMRAREAANTVVSSLDYVVRFLVEELDMDPSQHAPESTPEPPLQPEQFERHVLSHYRSATTEADRENVRALVERGRTGALITDEQATALLAKLT